MNFYLNVIRDKTGQEVHEVKKKKNQIKSNQKYRNQNNTLYFV